MHQRAALCAGENRFIKLGAEFLVIGKDNTAAGTAQGFMRGCCNDIGIGHRVHVQACCAESGDVSHINKQVCANLVCNFGKLCEINGTGICGCTRDDHFRLFFLC